MQSFAPIDRLPPYVFAIIDELKFQARWAGEDIIDFGMGNPDNPPPQPIIDKLCEAVKAMGSIEFAKHVLKVAKGAVSPGVCVLHTTRNVPGSRDGKVMRMVDGEEDRTIYANDSGRAHWVGHGRHRCGADSATPGRSDCAQAGGACASGARCYTDAFAPAR